MTQQICQSRQAERGFTLVELAIVMIIIGLLIGGILKGQELITNARVTSTVNQVKAIDAGLSTFRDQYSALPGDMGPAAVGPAVRLPNCAGVVCAAAGDGDTLIENLTATDPTVAIGDSEGGRAFVHLSAAGILGEINPAITAYGANALPDVKLGTGKLSIGYSNGTGASLNFAGTPALGNFGTGTYVTTNLNQTTTMGAANGVMIPKNAGNIDRKLDDGQPNTGSVRSAGANCASTATAVGIYQESRSDAVCGLAMRVQQ